MKNSRLLTAFYRLPKEELRYFKDFVRSPFFNKREELITLSDFLIHCREKRKYFPEKEEAFYATFPKQNYNDQQLRLVMSGLTKLVEQFLTYRSLTDDEVLNEIHLARAYRRLNLTKHFQQTLKKAHKIQEKQPYRNANYYNNNYLLHWESYLYVSASHRNTELNLQEVSDTIDLAFLARKLRQSCFSISHQAVYKTEYRFGLLSEILTYIEKNNLLEVPAISVYYHCYHSLTEPDQEAYFMKFKEQIFRFGNLFPPTEIRDLYLLAINYCIKRLNAGEKAYCDEGLDLYRHGLDNKVLLNEDKISRFTYNNIVAMGLRSKRYTWTKKFIHEYRPALAEDYRDSTFAFNLARLEYQQKNYRQALELLQKAEYKDLLNNLIAKTLMIKIYYELDETNLLQSHLDAMNIFIRRKRVMGYHKTNYRNIIYYTQKLISLNPYDRKKVSKLKDQIEQEEVLTEKGWLLEQLEE